MKINTLSKVSIPLSVLLLVGFSDAQAKALDSGPIYFQGGIVHPGSTLTLALNDKQLVPLRLYKVTCNIYNPNYKKQYPVVMSLHKFGYNGHLMGGMITVNGKDVPDGQAIMNHEVNEYESLVIVDYCPNCVVNMEFKNFDTSDAVIVENCMATYAT